MAKWWEKEPLRFECQPDCFKCCCKPGFVYFDREDIREISKYLNCTPSEFKSTYLKRDDGDWVIEVENDAPCTFLTCEGCSIHPSKPKQCRSYPFWKENLDSKNIWRLLGGFCPGVDRGPMVPVEEIKTILKKFRI
ncbi:MAG: YkgJ family cysteine cluster protein [Nitrospinaceae bacterium]